MQKGRFQPMVMPTTTSIKKRNLYFTRETRSTLSHLFCLAPSKLLQNNLEPNEIFKKYSRWGSRSFGHLMLLLSYRERQRNVPIIITHVQSYCSAH